jgi:hypothetical protein
MAPLVMRVFINLPQSIIDAVSRSASINKRLLLIEEISKAIDGEGRSRNPDYLRMDGLGGDDPRVDDVRIYVVWK